MSVQKRIGRIDLVYPRNDSGPRPADWHTEIHVGLEDVRAADDLVIDYDFERDGYRVRMATVHEWEPDDKEMDPKLVEVAFIPGSIEQRAAVCTVPSLGIILDEVATLRSTGRSGVWRDERCAALRNTVPGGHVEGCACSDRPR